MEYEYKSIAFGLTFSTKNGFNEKVQAYLDQYAKKGWRLHTVNVYGASASIGHIVFEREKKQ